MTTITDKSTHNLMWIAGIAVILFSVAGIAAIMGWIPTPIGHSVDSAEPVMSSEQSTNTANRVAARTYTADEPRTEEPRTEPQRADNSPPARETCAECGVIESTRAVTTKGEGSGIGAVGGAVVGGIIGNQVGAGRGNTVATAIGAVGGAVAGNEVEKRVKSSTGYQITVRLDDGTRRVIHQANTPAWHAGDHVRLVRGTIEANP